MLLLTYYARNYAGIIGASLFSGYKTDFVRPSHIIIETVKVTHQLNIMQLFIRIKETLKVCIAYDVLAKSTEDPL